MRLSTNVGVGMCNGYCVCLVCACYVFCLCFHSVFQWSVYLHLRVSSGLQLYMDTFIYCSPCCSSATDLVHVLVRVYWRQELLRSKLELEAGCVWKGLGAGEWWEYLGLFSHILRGGTFLWCLQVAISSVLEFRFVDLFAFMT